MKELRRRVQMKSKTRDNQEEGHENLPDRHDDPKNERA